MLIQEDDDTAYCVESDGNLATHERLIDITVPGADPAREFTETVELVCAEHATESDRVRS